MQKAGLCWQAVDVCMRALMRPLANTAQPASLYAPLCVCLCERSSTYHTLVEFGRRPVVNELRLGEQTASWQ